MKTEVANERISMPIWVAYCGVSRALRITNRLGAEFIAILILPPETDYQAYRFASDIFCARLMTEPQFYDRDQQVLFIGTDKKAADIQTQIGRGAFCKRTILLIQNEALISGRLRAAADMVVEIAPPTEAHFRAAVRYFYRYLPNNYELSFLVSQPLEQQQAAFRGNRRFNDAMRRLRQLSDTKAHGSQSAATEDFHGPTLGELHGYGEALNWGLELAQDIADWKAGKLGWELVDRGVLIAGPPGTGKTMFAHALARTCEVPLVRATAGEWQQAGHLDAMLQAMANTFNEAKQKAPAILFIDEIDAIGSRNNHGDRNSDYTRQVITRFLTLVDDQNARGGVVLVGATNHPEFVNPAIKRAGRLDRQFDIPLPDGAARTEIFTHHSGVRLDGQDFIDFATRSRGLTGSDIERLVRDGKRDARRRSSEFKVADVLKWLPGIVRLPEEMLRACAVHEVGHAIAELHVPFVTLDSLVIKGEALRSGVPEPAGWASYFIDETVRHTKQYYLDLIMIDLAGIAAEQEVLGSHSDGSGGDERADLVRATDRATMIEAVFGMGERLTSHPSRDIGELRKLRTLDWQLDVAVQKILNEQFDRATEIIRNNRAALEELVEELLLSRFVFPAGVKKVFEKHGGKVTVISEPS